MIFALTWMVIGFQCDGVQNISNIESVKQTMGDLILGLVP